MVQEETRVESTLAKADGQQFDLMRSLEQGVASGQMSVEVVERLVALQERQEEKRAEAELIQALHNFQKECPAVAKTRPVRDRDGIKMYDYAAFEDVVKTARPLLEKNNLMFSHSVDGKESVTCTVMHGSGAVTKSSFPIVVSGGGAMNDTQRMASAVSYAKRYSLLGALGISTFDDDGRGAEDPVTKADLKDIYERFIAKHGGGDDGPERFRDWLRSNVFDDGRADEQLSDPNAWNQSDLRFAKEVISRVSFSDYATPASNEDPHRAEHKWATELGVSLAKQIRESLDPSMMVDAIEVEKPKLPENDYVELKRILKQRMP